MATRTGLAKFVDPCGYQRGERQPAVGLLSFGIYGYRRREWQLELGLLSLGFLGMSATRVATRIGLALLGSDLLGFGLGRAEWDLR